MVIVVTIEAPHLNSDEDFSHSEISSLVSAVGFHSKLIQGNSGVLIDEIEGHHPMTVNYSIECED